MTNQEKAKEISFNQYKEYSYEGCDGLEYTDDSIIECEKSALEMAEWKDQQFKDYLEKKKASIDNYAQARMFSPFINEILNELFGE